MGYAVYCCLINLQNNILYPVTYHKPRENGLKLMVFIVNVLVKNYLYYSRNYFLFLI